MLYISMCDARTGEEITASKVNDYRNHRIKSADVSWYAAVTYGYARALMNIIIDGVPISIFLFFVFLYSLAKFRQYEHVHM